MGKPTDVVQGVLRAKTFFHRPKTVAIILAGGTGERMGSKTTKQMMLLLGKPVIVHTLEAFEACPRIDEIVVVVRPEERIAVTLLCEKYGITKCHALVIGGDTRQESAERGLAALSDDIEYIAIHDAARPLITSAQISRVVTYAYVYHAATAVTPVYDTVKTVNVSGFIEKTVPRDSVRLAATPQVFHRRYYEAAMKFAKDKNVIVTDDNSLMELIGQRVRTVDTGRENLKITVAGDLPVAEAILRCRGKKHGRD